MTLALLVAAAAFALGAAALALGPASWRSSALSRLSLIAPAAATLAAAWAPGHPTGRPVVDLLARMIVAAVVAFGLAAAPPLVSLLAAAPLAVSCALASTAPQPAAWLMGLTVGLAATQLAVGKRSALLSSIGGAALATAVSRLVWPTWSGGTATMAGLTFLVGLVAAMTCLPRAPRRVVRWGTLVGVSAAVICAASAGLVALSVRTKAQVAVSEARLGLDAASHGDRDAALAHLTVARRNFEALKGRLDSPFIKSAGWLPVVAPHLDAARDLAHDGVDLSDSAYLALSAADPHEIKVGSGQINVKLVASLQQPFRQLVSTLDRTRTDLDDLDSVWLTPILTDKIDELRQRIDNVSESAHNTAELVALAPDLLGNQQTRRYFLAVLTPAEMRGSIGILGNWGEITIDHGNISLTRQGRNTDLNDFGQKVNRKLIAPPEYVRRYAVRQPEQIWQEVPSSPNFPDVASTIGGLYPQSGGEPVDGVIAIDPIALAGLLKITGPVAVAGWPEPLTAENAAKILLFDQYAAFGNDLGKRTGFLSDATGDIWHRLLDSDLDPHKLGDVLGPIIRGKHLMITTFPAAEAAMFHQLKADGAFPTDPGDRLAVTSLNQGGNKIDWFLHRTIDYQLKVDATGEVNGEVRVHLRNDAPSSGLPPYIIGGTAYGPADFGTNRLWLTLYTPWTVTSTTVNGGPPTSKQDTEFGLGLTAVYLQIPSSGEADVVFKVHGRTDPRNYSLTVVHQPTINPDTLHLDVQLPPSANLDLGPGLSFDNGRLTVNTANSELTQDLRATAATTQK